MGKRMKRAPKQVIISHPKDNVATAISLLRSGSLLDVSREKKIYVRDEIPFGHKTCLRRIARGAPVIKYGERIGRATCEIRPGQLVHTHNVEGERGKRKAK
jgi:altronate dehydratase small subunit